MTKVIEYLLKHHKVTNMIVLIIFLAGIFSALTIQRKTDPDVSMGVIKITTLYPGASPEDVEINVTNKIEDELMEVENINRMTSLSMENISIITLILDIDAADQDKIKTDIRDAVGRVTDLPEAVTQKPTLSEITSNSIQLMELALTGDIDEKDLRKYTKALEERFKEISGVSKIEKIGYRKREIKIDVDMEKMKDNKLSFMEVMSAIKNRNVRLSGGTIESFVSEKKILTLSEYEQPLDVKDVIIRSTFSGTQLRLTDVATIEDDYETPQVIYRGNGKPGISMLVLAQKTADNIKLSNKLRKEIAKFKKDLPGEINIDIVMDTSDETRTILSMAGLNGIIGFLLVLIVMFLFLDAKSAFWAAYGIPFSIFGALIFFKPLGIQLHSAALMTIIIIVGIVVDDAIVVAENIYNLKQGGMDSRKATLLGASSMVGPVTASALTTIIGFGTILFIGGVFGKLLYSIPVVVFLILTISLIDALFFVPVHVKNIKPPKTVPRRIRWLEPLKSFYKNGILFALKYRITFITGYILLFIAVLLLSVFTMKFVLIDVKDYDYFNIIIEAPQGTSLSKTSDMVTEIERIVEKSVPADVLSSYTTQIGHHDTELLTGGGGKYTNWALIMVALIPAQDRKIKCEDIMANLNKKFKDEGIDKKFKRIGIEAFGGLNAGKAIDVSFISNDDKIRKEFEEEALAFLRNTNGVKDVDSSNIKGKEEINLKLDYSQLAKVELTALDVAQTVRTAFDGSIVTSIRRDGEDINYRVKIKDPERFRADNILDLPVANNKGQMINLSHLARLYENEGVAVIKHESGKRAVTITANVDKDIITSSEVNKLLTDKFDERVAKKPGLRMKFSGEQEETMKSMAGFLFAVIIAIIAIYFILVIVFDSYLQPVLVMSVIPFAIVGVMLTLFLHRMPISLVPLIGIIGLIGVVVNATIVMISHFNNKIKEQGASFEVIAEGAKERFRPVILTALTTFAGLLPTAYGIGGDMPSLRPMVLVMAWGLVFSTFITLGFTPLIYSVLMVRKKKKN